MATQQKSKPAQLDDVSERISAALAKIRGNISDLRWPSIIGHLNSVASNLEADVRDQTATVNATQATADTLKQKAVEAQKLADEAAIAAGLPAAGTMVQQPAQQTQTKVPSAAAPVAAAQAPAMEAPAPQQQQQQPPQPKAKAK